MRLWIGIAIAGAMLSACDGRAPVKDGRAPVKRDDARAREALLVVRWGGVGIGPEREELTARDSMGEKKSVLEYPAVAEAPTPQLRASLQAALSLDSVFEVRVQQYRRDFHEDRHLRINASYAVTFHRDHLLDVLYQLEDSPYMGGASRYGFRHRVFDLRTGTRMTAEQMFHASSHAELAGIVDRRMPTCQAEKDPGNRPRDDSPARFGVEDLDHVAISDRGVMFILETTRSKLFPEEDASCSFYWAELRPYIRPDGPLAPFAGR